MKSDRLPVRSELDVVRARQAVRAWAVDMRFTLVDQTKLVTAASEIIRNALIYGGGGEVSLQQIEGKEGVGLRVTVKDSGPGIANIPQAMRDGYSSGTGLGLGLGGAKRLVNEFAIESIVGQGTCVSIVRWR